jgi:pimeloyl-ACP methyl ester carboxylesterase
MSRSLLPLLVSVVALSGCIDIIDESWFSPAGLETDSYEGDLALLEWNEIPEANIEFVELEGSPVEGEDEAPTLHGVWIHPCVDGQCVTLPHPEFSAVNQDKTLLYLHGNGGHLLRYWDRYEIFWRMGYRIFAIDYRGFGLSSGTASEAGVYADSRTGLDHILERISEETGVDNPNPLFIDLGYYGWSLGSTAAIDLAVEFPPRLLITEAALASAQAFVDDAAGLGISSSVLMDAEFDNIGKVPFIISPKLFTHGRDDDFVRWEFSAALHEEAADPTQLFTLDGADHGNVPCPSRPLDEDIDNGPCRAEPIWLETVAGFLDEHMP